MENKEIKLNIQLTEKDYLTFLKTNQSGFKSKKWIIYGIMFLCVYLFVALPTIIANGFSNIEFVSLAPLLIPLLIGSLVFIFVKLSVKMVSKRAFRTDAFINRPYGIIINDQGLQINSDHSNFHPLWEDIYRFRITKDAYIIYLSSIKVIILPKRFFNNEIDIKRMNFLIKNKIDGSKYDKTIKSNNYIRLSCYIVISCIIAFVFFRNCDKENLYSKAGQFEANEDYMSAFKIYTQLIYQDPTKPNCYLYRAKCSQYIGNYIMAVQDCEQAINLGAKDGYAYSIYASALYDNQQYDKACEAIKTSIKLGYAKDTEYFCEQ